MTGISRRQYAKRRGRSETSVRNRIKDGTLAGAMLPDGTIDADQADQLLAERTTAGKHTSGDLSEARKRKAAAGVALLHDEVAGLAARVVSAAGAGKIIRGESLRIARRLFKIADDAAPLAIGKEAAEASAAVYNVIWDALADLSGSDGMGGEDGDDAEPVKQRPNRGRPLGSMTAAAIATLKADLEAERLEIRRALAQGDLVEIAQIGAEYGARLSIVRNRVLSAHVKLAPYFISATEAEARQMLEAEIAEAVDELASPHVTTEELTAGRATTWPGLRSGGAAKAATPKAPASR